MLKEYISRFLLSQTYSTVQKFILFPCNFNIYKKKHNERTDSINDKNREMGFYFTHYNYCYVFMYVALIDCTKQTTISYRAFLKINAFSIRCNVCLNLILNPLKYD